jgi:hypothetical protein
MAGFGASEIGLQMGILGQNGRKASRTLLMLALMQSHIAQISIDNHNQTPSRNLAGSAGG